jgi:hypothetical protein
MSNETRGFTQCNICGMKSINYHITEHAKRCKVLSQSSEDNHVLHDPESVEMPDPLNDRCSFYDSASFSSLIAATPTTVKETHAKTEI